MKKTPKPPTKNYTKSFLLLGIAGLFNNIAPIFLENAKNITQSKNIAFIFFILSITYTFIVLINNQMELSNENLTPEPKPKTNTIKTTPTNKQPPTKIIPQQYTNTTQQRTLKKDLIKLQSKYKQYFGLQQHTNTTQHTDRIYINNKNNIISSYNPNKVTLIK